MVGVLGRLRSVSEPLFIDWLRIDRRPRGRMKKVPEAGRERRVL